MTVLRTDHSVAAHARFRPARVVLGSRAAPRTTEGPPGRAIRLWSLALPVLKCAFCPACLSLFGGLLAGARMGFVGDARFHASLIAVALVADFFILRAATRHHRNRWPLALCIAGGLVAIVGHFTAEALEYAGFGLLMLAAVQNIVLLRRHRREDGSCCVHDARSPLRGPIHEPG